MVRFVLIANPASRRVELLQAAITAAGLPAAQVVPWIDLLAERVDLSQIVRAGEVVRLDSPGKDFDVERAILAAGADVHDEEDPRGVLYNRAPAPAVQA